MPLNGARCAATGAGGVAASFYPIALRIGQICRLGDADMGAAERRCGISVGNAVAGGYLLQTDARQAEDKDASSPAVRDSGS